MGLCALALAGSGCITPSPSDTFPPAADSTVLLLQPGDVLGFKFAYWPELDNEQRIRPDGKVSLQYVHEVVAAGKTPEQLRLELVDLYQEKLKDPEISVLAERLDSRRVYVGGEVRLPSAIEIPGRLTVVDAIIKSGGFVNTSARKRKVLVMRERDGVRYAKVLNIRKNLSVPESTPFYLEPYDVVWVPPLPASASAQRPTIPTHSCHRRRAT